MCWQKRHSAMQAMDRAMLDAHDALLLKDTIPKIQLFVYQSNRIGNMLTMISKPQYGHLSKRVLVCLACLVLLCLPRSQVAGMTTCADEEKNCKSRCGPQSQYDFDCDDDQNGARAFSCACRSTGEWSEVASIPSGFATPFPFDMFPGTAGRDAAAVVSESGDNVDYCTRERASCVALCGNITAPDFDCKDEASKDGSSTSQSSACACQVDSTATPATEPTTKPSGTASTNDSIDMFLPQNRSCEVSRLSCQKSCPEGSKADFQCESRSAKDGSPLQDFSSSCACVPLDIPQDGNLSGNLQSTDGEVATDASFRAGAKYVIQYMMASLLVLQAAMGLDNEAE